MRNVKTKLEEMIKNGSAISRVRPGPKAGWTPQEYICPHRGQVSRSHLVSPMVMVIINDLNDDHLQEALASLPHYLALFRLPSPLLVIVVMLVVVLDGWS